MNKRNNSHSETAKINLKNIELENRENPFPETELKSIPSYESLEL